MPRDVFRLRTTCCNAYPHLMDMCQAAVDAVLPASRVSRCLRIGCTDVAAYSKHWPCLIPQHGSGMKHTRRIVLLPWQDTRVHQHPKDFLCGLIHSDGCRSINSIRAKNGETYRYPRYEFSNRSEDIKQLFCWACDVLGVEWKVMNRYTTSINKRADVAFLDTFIGPKT
jgi:hypothetical protein